MGLLLDLVTHWRPGRRAWAAAQRVRAMLPHQPFPIILNYHRIAEEAFDPWGMAVTPEHFREHLSWLAESRTVLPLKDFADLHSSGRLPRGAVALTFDDGYACNAAVAAPLLADAGLPATFFLPVRSIGRDAFWWDELQEIVLGEDGTTLSVEGKNIPIGPKTGSDEVWKPSSAARTARQSAYYDLHVRLSRIPPARAEDAIARLRGKNKSGKARRGLKRPMTRQEVGAMAGAYVEFGSHALDHAWLPNLDAREKRHEICDSFEECQSLIGSRPVAFAYPYGMFDRQSEMLAREAGFDCACTTGGVAVSRVSRPFALPRMPVGDGDAASLENALARVRAA